MSSPRLLRQALPSVPWRGAYSRYRPQETAANEISSANIVVSPPSSPSSEPSMALRPPQSLLYLDSRPSNEGSFQSFPSPAAPSNGLASPLDIPLSLPTYESRPDSSLLLRKSSSLSQEIRPSNEQFSPSSVPSLLAHPSSPRSSPNIRVRHLGEMFHISRSGSLSPAHRHRGRKRLVDLTGRIPKPKYPNTQGAFAFVYKSKLVTSRGTTGVRNSARSPSRFTR
ncbi:hypothetical protein F5I97DRAFT_644580 [Phlebopus sp. FC_14]|nr:hypothetical protein F5I97DRAFT_644580 [Phlebopus sp. FC_14]